MKATILLTSLGFLPIHADWQLADIGLFSLLTKRAELSVVSPALFLSDQLPPPSFSALVFLSPLILHPSDSSVPSFIRLRICLSLRLRICLWCCLQLLRCCRLWGRLSPSL